MVHGQQQNGDHSMAFPPVKGRHGEPPNTLAPARTVEELAQDRDSGGPRWCSARPCSRSSWWGCWPPLPSGRRPPSPPPLLNRSGLARTVSGTRTVSEDYAPDWPAFDWRTQHRFSKFWIVWKCYPEKREKGSTRIFIVFGTNCSFKDSFFRHCAGCRWWRGPQHGSFKKTFLLSILSCFGLSFRFWFFRCSLAKKRSLVAQRIWNLLVAR